MKTKLIFFDIEFTSLSPDAQIISLGVISDCGKSFYAEFTDFDISRCDDWVRNNVVSKLQNIDTTTAILNGEIILCSKDSHKLIRESITCHLHDKFTNIGFALKWWLSKFSDYKIQFVVDCGTWDWYWLLQLLAEWDKTACYDMLIIPDCNLSDEQKKEICENWSVVSGSSFIAKSNYEAKATKQGLPKLADNISPVPMDLNDLIAFKKGISVSEAFDLNREELAFPTKDSEPICYNSNDKHNSLCDAKVIKAIYEQLNS
ncbi:MAG: hypothetical protein ACMV0Y_06075 [Paludibacter sp.]